MNLYIQIENGQPINHPAFEDNLLQAFGSIPAHWEPFVRVERPALTIFQILESDTPTYQQVNGVWTDVWSYRDMTADEKSALIAETQANPLGPNLTLNTETLQWTPNTPKPTDGKNYYWNYQTGAWVVATDTPSA